MNRKTTTVPLLVLDGDGISAEICEATMRVVESAGRRFGIEFRFESLAVGFAALARFGSTIPDNVLDAARRHQGIILGPVSHNEYPPVAEGGLNPSGVLRKELDLYANIRPAKAREGVPLRCGTSIDLVIVRENTEGFYADRSMHMGPGEFMPTPEVALAVRKVTRSGSLRIAEQAFLQAKGRRRKLTVVHKANVLRLSDGLFLDCVREVAGRFPEVEYEEQLIDAMAALLVRDPSRFDVVVATNMFGDILSDQASEISGSLGLGASLNAGETQAIAQAQHGSAPDIAGKDLANPVSLISSTAMLLNWLGERSKEAALIAAAAGIEQAISGAIADKATRTRDIGGPLGTRAFTDAVIGRLETAG